MFDERGVRTLRLVVTWTWILPLLPPCLKEDDGRVVKKLCAVQRRKHLTIDRHVQTVVAGADCQRRRLGVSCCLWKFRSAQSSKKSSRKSP